MGHLHRGSPPPSPPLSLVSPHVPLVRSPPLGALLPQTSHHPRALARQPASLIGGAGRCKLFPQLRPCVRECLAHRAMQPVELGAVAFLHPRDLAGLLVLELGELLSMIMHKRLHLLRLLGLEFGPQLLLCLELVRCSALAPRRQPGHLGLERRDGGLQLPPLTLRRFEVLAKLLIHLGHGRARSGGFVELPSQHLVLFLQRGYPGLGRRDGLRAAHLHPLCDDFLKPVPLGVES
mmetsp:Transcript_99690/g.284990  ORF Transcript_99690/g.284990 Transcript_99690/m.284990 type:complete len:235 (+) Transcript_99690:1841-2545(+)